MMSIVQRYLNIQLLVRATSQCSRTMLKRRKNLLDQLQELESAFNRKTRKLNKYYEVLKKMRKGKPSISKNEITSPKMVADVPIEET